MIKNYNPEKAYGKIHVIEATYMFDDTKVVVCQKIDDCVGDEALQIFADTDSGWLGDKPYNLLKGKLEYDETSDSVIVTMNDGNKNVIGGDYLRDYLVKVEIVDVEDAG